MHYIQSSVPKNMKDCSTSQLICEKFIVASNVGCCHPMAMAMAALDGIKHAITHTFGDRPCICIYNFQKGI